MLPNRRLLVHIRTFIRFMRKKRTQYTIQGMLLAFVLVVLFLATPLHVYLPGYLDVSKRALVMESAMRIDSLELQNDLRLAYLNNMLSILRDRVKADSLMPYDSTVSRIQDTLLSASEREMRFVNEYERRERFGVTALDVSNPAVAGVSFLAPVKGKVSLSEQRKSSGVCRIELSTEVPVMVPLEGTIVSVSYLLGEGYKVVMQHSNDYITIYNHLNTVNAEPGQLLKAGYAFARAGAYKDPSRCWMELQVWHKGEPLDVPTVIPIE